MAVKNTFVHFVPFTFNSYKYLSAMLLLLYVLISWSMNLRFVAAGDGELLEDGEEESDQAAGAQERSNSPPLLDQLVTKSLHDITNVPHLVCVMEMFLRLALTEGEGTDQYKDHILTALDICMIIWKVEKHTLRTLYFILKVQLYLHQLDVCVYICIYGNR